MEDAYVTYMISQSENRFLMKNCIYIIIVQVSPCYHTSFSFTSLHALEKKTQPPYEMNKEKGEYSF